MMFVCIYLLSCFVFFTIFFTKTNGHSKRFYDRELEPRSQDSQLLITNFSIFFTRVCFSGTKVNWWLIYKTHFFTIFCFIFGRRLVLYLYACAVENPEISVLFCNADKRKVCLKGCLRIKFKRFSYRRSLAMNFQ